MRAGGVGARGGVSSGSSSGGGIVLVDVESILDFVDSVRHDEGLGF